MKIKILLISLVLAQLFYSQNADYAQLSQKLNQNRLEIFELSRQVQYTKMYLILQKPCVRLLSKI